MNTMRDEAILEKETVNKVTWRLMPFLIVCYLLAFIDRGNIGMAALQMNHDIGITPQVFGFASSLFFIAYFFSFKGPFWALSTGWLSAGSAAAGLAGINAASNLIGGGLMVNVYGWIKAATGSYALALAPLALLALMSITVLLLLGRQAQRTAPATGNKKIAA